MPILRKLTSNIRRAYKYLKWVWLRPDCNVCGKPIPFQDFYESGEDGYCSMYCEQLDLYGW